MKTYIDLLKSVENTLANEPLLKNHLANIRVHVNADAVTLSGSVENIKLKKLIRKIVAEIPEVDMIVENIKVEPIYDRVDVQIDWTKGKMVLA